MQTAPWSQLWWRLIISLLSQNASSLREGTSSWTLPSPTARWGTLCLCLPWGSCRPAHLLLLKPKAECLPSSCMPSSWKNWPPLPRSTASHWTAVLRSSLNRPSLDPRKSLLYPFHLLYLFEYMCLSVSKLCNYCKECCKYVSIQRNTCIFPGRTWLLLHFLIWERILFIAEWQRSENVLCNITQIKYLHHQQLIYEKTNESNRLIFLFTCGKDQ